MSRQDQIRLMSITEAADFVSVSDRTIRRWISTGELTAHRFGRQWRISRSDLLAFIHRHRDAGPLLS